MKWRHWGGGDDEDIFVQFGLNTCQYFLRVRKLLSTPAAAALSPDEKAHLRQICFTRLDHCRLAEAAGRPGRTDDGNLNSQPATRMHPATGHPRSRVPG